MGPRLTAIVVDPSGTVYAAGNGALVVLRGDALTIEATGIEAGPLAIDEAGAVWMASVGRIVRRDGPQVFRVVWADPASTSRFAGLAVRDGRVVAFAKDGSVVEAGNTASAG